MADPRLNSMHLDLPRRQDYRRARDVLLRARGCHTICASDDLAPSFEHTVIENDTPEDVGLTCWLNDGQFIYPLKVGVNTLGRASENDVVVDGLHVSRRHCALLVHTNESCEVHDTASKNGTYVNGARLSGPVSLRSGDEIRISNLQFVFLTRSADPDGAFPQATLSR